jgi:hypothetical protein
MSKLAPLRQTFDYLVVGAGASGLAFLDTLLLSHPRARELRVALVDPHTAPGGHWNDDYAFVRLHQAADNYGVQSDALEDGVEDAERRATRTHILAYYERVLQRHMASGSVEFFAGMRYDFASGALADAETGEACGDGAPLKCDTLVDARYTQNDVPSNTPPRFRFNPERVHVVPVNALSAAEKGEEKEKEKEEDERLHYVVVGGGKTGQDTILHLLTEKHVAPENIMWIVPNDFWITARDPPDGKMDTCTEFLALANATTQASISSPEYIQTTFEELERRGKVYRFDQTVRPTKFMNATLNKEEVGIIQTLVKKNSGGSINRSGRLAAIEDDGTLVFASGERQALPWSAAGDGGGVLETTTFVHCSCGAFNFSASADEVRPPVFGEGVVSGRSAEGRAKTSVITVQEVFQYPGFCFNGSLIAKLECDAALSTEEKNALCELPLPPSPPPSEGGSAGVRVLGPSAGTISGLSTGHPLCVSTRNAMRWYEHGLGKWLHGHRLYSLHMNGYTAEEGEAMVRANLGAFEKAGF